MPRVHRLECSYSGPKSFMAFGTDNLVTWSFVGFYVSFSSLEHFEPWTVNFDQKFKIITLESNFDDSIRCEGH